MVGAADWSSILRDTYLMIISRLAFDRVHTNSAVCRRHASSSNTQSCIFKKYFPFTIMGKLLPYLSLIHLLVVRGSYSRIWNKRSPLNKNSPWRIWQRCGGGYRLVSTDHINGLESHQYTGEHCKYRFDSFDPTLEKTNKHLLVQTKILRLLNSFLETFQLAIYDHLFTISSKESQKGLFSVLNTKLSMIFQMIDFRLQVKKSSKKLF